MDELITASNRSDKKILNDIAKCLKTLDDLSIKLNRCRAKFELSKAINSLYSIIYWSGYELSTNYKLIKKCNNTNQQ